MMKRTIIILSLLFFVPFMLGANDGLPKKVKDKVAREQVRDREKKKDKEKDKDKLSRAEKDSLEMVALEPLLFDDNYLDTVTVHKTTLINDYHMLGVNYGVTFGQFSFSPSRHNRAWVMVPNYFSIMYTHYEKMFGYIANFGFRVGLEYGHEASGFKYNDETGYYYNYVDGANQLILEVVDVPVMACFHVDAAPLKFQGAVGVYGGYRLSIQREGEFVAEQYLNAFRDYEYRFDYGLRGNAGFAFMIDPVELHFNAEVRWGWKSLYEADYNSPYYYRFAYPIDVTFTVGLHFQLGKRTGKTSSYLRRQAKEIVYGTTADPES